MRIANDVMSIRKVKKFDWLLGTASGHFHRIADRVKTSAWNRIFWCTLFIICSFRPGRCQRSGTAHRHPFDHSIYADHPGLFPFRRECGHARFVGLSRARIFGCGVLVRSIRLHHRQHHGHACLLVYRPQGYG